MEIMCKGDLFNKSPLHIISTAGRMTSSSYKVQPALKMIYKVLADFNIVEGSTGIDQILRQRLRRGI